MRESYYDLDKSSLNSAKAVEEYNRAKKEELKKEDYYNNKPIEQNDKIIDKLETTEKSINEIKELINKPRKIDWAILIVTIIGVIIAFISLLKR